MKKQIKLQSSLRATNWDQLTLSANHRISLGSQRGTNIYLLNFEKNAQVKLSNCIVQVSNNMMQSPNQTTKSKLKVQIQTFCQKYKILSQGYSKLSKKKIWKDIKDTKVQEVAKKKI